MLTLFLVVGVFSLLLTAACKWADQPQEREEYEQPVHVRIVPGGER